ncbi:helix-turn-helix domain-containing protein [Conexibacter sp. SYSU D00693]|uniref:winged helix-turn-helix transcriptional regulator n=1 Tax=Conexibacter sp. SYSU D00693 TaxID=2812560 RepID=UPI00196B1A4E|nr:helix-turn-helix domain-containing protein [Conexibacter sp. SYSU D00693]
MRHDELLEQTCAIGRAGAIVGERWVFAILRAAFFRARTFEDYQRGTGVARNILAERLGRLVDFGILERVPYAEGARRTRHEYRLTEAGRDLYPVVIALMEWGNKHTGLVDGPPVVLHHKRCNHVSHPQVVCSECGEPVDARDFQPLPGPGAPRETPPWAEPAVRHAHRKAAAPTAPPRA